MGIYNPRLVQQFLDALTEGSLTKDQLEVIRDSQVQPDSDSYKKYFNSQIDALVGTAGYGERLAGKEGLVEIHKSGELVAIGFLTGGAQDIEVITPSGLEAATSAYITEGQKYHGRTAELSNLETVFQNVRILIPLATAGVIDLNQYHGANPIFRSGYSGLFGAANESKSK